MNKELTVSPTTENEEAEIPKKRSASKRTESNGASSSRKLVLEKGKDSNLLLMSEKNDFLITFPLVLSPQRGGRWRRVRIPRKTTFVRAILRHDEHDVLRVRKLQLQSTSSNVVQIIQVSWWKLECGKSPCR